MLIKLVTAIPHPTGIWLGNMLTISPQPLCVCVCVHVYVYLETLLVIFFGPQLI